MFKTDNERCIIIPAYNEEKNIGSFVEEIKSMNPEMDVIIIDDCSTDRTREILVGLGLRVISLPSNLGIGGAVQTGFLFAVNKGYRVAIRMDGDGQHDPRYINVMCERIVEDKVNIVIGSRYIDRKGYQSTWIRRVGSKIISLLIYFLCKAKITDPTSGYWAMDSKALKVFGYSYQQDYPEPEAILSAITHGLKIIEIPVEMRDRAFGKSTIDFKRSLYYMIKVSLSLLFAKINQREYHDIDEV